MIWTTPITGMEPDQHTQSHSHSTGMENEAPSVGITATMQARSLHIACAYFKSLDIPALLALIGAACPGEPTRVAWCICTTVKPTVCVPSFSLSPSQPTNTHIHSYSIPPHPSDEQLRDHSRRSPPLSVHPSRSHYHQTRLHVSSGSLHPPPSCPLHLRL